MAVAVAASMVRPSPLSVRPIWAPVALLDEVLAGDALSAERSQPASDSAKPASRAGKSARAIKGWGKGRKVFKALLLYADEPSRWLVRISRKACSASLRD